MFNRAQRRKSRLRIALSGTAGSGKTYSALLIAKGLGGRTALVDTERGSANLYSHVMDFDVMELAPPYKPERFIEAIYAAQQAGYENLIIDSISHEWNGSGGILEIVDALASASRSGNSFGAWKEATPRHRAFIDSILNSSLHVIATMRSKTAYVLEVNDKGRQTPRKVGLAPEQREGTDFEFTTILELTPEAHLAVASKDRSGLFSGAGKSDPFIITEDTGAMLRRWLDSGSDVPRETLPTPQSLIELIQEADLAGLDAIANQIKAHGDKYTADDLKAVRGEYRKQLAILTKGDAR